MLQTALWRAQQWEQERECLENMLQATQETLHSTQDVWTTDQRT